MHPEPLDDVQNFSPELIYLWARGAILDLELDAFTEEIEHYYTVIKDEEDEDFVKSLQEHIAEYRKAIETHQEELKFVKEKYEEDYKQWFEDGGEEAIKVDLIFFVLNLVKILILKQGR